MKKYRIQLAVFIIIFCLSTNKVFCQSAIKKTTTTKIAKQKYIPQLGDIGDLFGGGPVGDPPICSTFEDLEKWNKYVKTNDEKIIDGTNVEIFFLQNGDKIRITDFNETKWGKAFEFRVLKGENKDKIGWGRISDFRLIKSKFKQDKEANAQGE